ncbi:hypothetical protein FJT64_026622 [Amphibalanus amphitrite]|uniref:Uncharacterized protein n=1 Tax=Amphibalanus amphitrite TaxID=1232801 RepID=A0A6A4WG29_AMPAM|nr:hypothetical protein FJT64_026622 [Amphibalanus amphitrite]
MLATYAVSPYTVELLHSFEAEVVQLRGLSHELMRELRAGNRQVEVAKMAEAMAADENRRLNELVRKQNGTISSIQKVGATTDIIRPSVVYRKSCSGSRSRRTPGRRVAPLSPAQWEDRLRQERSALKAELDALHSEEKHLAVESVRVQLEQQLQTAKQEQEQTVRKLEQEVGPARRPVPGAARWCLTSVLTLQAGPARRPVPGAARLAAVLTALQECGDHLVRLIAARDEQRLRSVRVLVPARLRQLNGRGAP